jgi:hypothetical protein
MRGWRDAEHLFRLAGLFLAGLTLFLLARAWLVPEGFGAYGHYRPSAVDEAAALPIRYAGRAACGECHDEIVVRRAGGSHERIGCESCHGPAAAHAGDPTESKPPRPDPRSGCLECHLRLTARPASHPQVDPAEHAGDTPCTECHDPHHPDL